MLLHADGLWYPGKLTGCDGAKWHIDFEDGDKDTYTLPHRCGHSRVLAIVFLPCGKRGGKGLQPRRRRAALPSSESLCHLFQILVEGSKIRLPRSCNLRLPRSCNLLENGRNTPKISTKVASCGLAPPRRAPTATVGIFSGDLNSGVVTDEVCGCSEMSRSCGSVQCLETSSAITSK